MTPQQHASDDAAALQELGRASVEVVHDIKNQLNGLKLYATFLRRRCERDQRPADELETVNKIIAGLERSAAELNLLVRYGRPVELRRAPQTDLAEIVRAASGGDAGIEAGGATDFRGDFDAEKLGEALAHICAAARAHSPADSPAHVSLRREASEGEASALVEWRGVAAAAGANGKNIFGALDGNASLRTALAARIISAHGGAVAHEGDTVSVRIPLKES
jgi:light-regulated signal transduction histidine kinase (bacteriophytochrome)